jgi:4,5-dihydroxyphthalate decarboxylase
MPGETDLLSCGDPAVSGDLEAELTKLALTIACNDYDRTRALSEGQVLVEGCDINVINLGSEEVFYRTHRGAQFDVCEMSMSRYLINTGRGESSYVAIPVFLSRTFRHSAIYIRTDRNIATAADLKGRAVGVPEYQMTAALWVRGLLEDQFGVRPADIRWRNGGLEMAGRTELLDLDLPEGVDLQPISANRTLSQALADGEIDALIASKAPSCFTAGHPQVARLFPDYRAAERDYFRQTRIFPIMHVVAVRRELLEQNPWLATSLYKAFLEAKQACLPRLAGFGVMIDTLPWLAAEVEETKALMGDDYWPYGVEKNGVVLEAMTRYAHNQGLTAQRLGIADLFPFGGDDSFKR